MDLERDLNKTIEMINSDSTYRFDRVYPFATENVGACLSSYDFNNKDCLTVLGSGVQALYMFMKGAKSVCAFDVNSLSIYYYEFLKAFIKSGLDFSSYRKLFIKSFGNKDNYSIDVYARYAEIEGAVLSSSPLSKGTFISKIYDLGTLAKYRFIGADYTTNGHDNDVVFYVRGMREGKLSLVFTPWKQFDPKASELNQIEYEDYSLFQFKVEIKSSAVVLKLNAFRMEVV